MCPKESMFQQDMEHILDVVGSRGSTARFVGRLDLALCNLVHHLSVVNSKNVCGDAGSWQ